LVKRLIDVAVVITGGMLVAPLLLLIAAAIRCISSGPILYGQERIGLGGRPFLVWKFRTMVVDAETVLNDYLQRHPDLQQEWEKDRKLKNDPRVIPWIGRFMRKSSLDELPQLWNVLVGNMSLVGPRPLPQYHLDQFDEEFRRYRERITPGITGMWQITGRCSGDPEMFVKWDAYYIRNWSLWLDLWILCRTPKVVFSGNGAY
jgi:lipopolysaccharide/colanic/teichoic acid biosynthesis glycosyltransferase